MAVAMTELPAYPDRFDVESDIQTDKVDQRRRLIRDLFQKFRKLSKSEELPPIPDPNQVSPPQTPVRPGAGRRFSRKGSVGLPRSTTFRTQESEQRERLTPLETVNVDRRTVAKQVARSPRALPQRPVFDNDSESGRAIIQREDPVDSHNPFNNDGDFGNDASAGEALDEQLQDDLDTKWILNLSMHFGDKSSREKFFVTYTETPFKSRKVTVSCDYRNTPPDSLEQDLKALPNQRDKSAAIYEALHTSLPNIQFFDTVTNLNLETRDGRLHVHVTEDVNEIIPPPAENLIQDIESPRVSENQARPWMQEESRGRRNMGEEGFDVGNNLYAFCATFKTGQVEAPEQELLQKWSAPQPNRVFHTLPQKARLIKRKQGWVGFANGTDIAAMADTGSRENVISASYAKELGLQVEGSPSFFKIGNAKKIQSLGTVSLLWAFAENPKEIFSVLCHVLPRCTYNLILGNGFLTATETLSKFSHRLSKCFFSTVNNVSHFGFLGETYQRLQGTIADTHQVSAIPDTGADRNVMSLKYAIDHGLEIETEPNNRGYLQFADGSFDATEGQVKTYWTFASEVIIGEDILTEHNVFQEHAGSILWDSAFDTDSYELAPFDFVNAWQRGCDRLIKKVSSKKGPSHQGNPAADARIEEQQRRNVWNRQYDFGASASTGEKELEAARRERYRTIGNSGDLASAYNPHTESRGRRVPVIPCIPTSHSGG